MILCQWIIVSIVISPFVSFPFRFSWFLFTQTKGELVRDCLRVKARLHWRFLLRFQITRVNYRRGIASSLHCKFALEIATKIASVQNGPLYSIQTSLNKVQTSCLRLPVRAPFPKG